MEQMAFMSLQKKKNTAPQNTELDLFELLTGKQHKQKEYFTDRPISRLSEFYLSGNIETADNYIEWFDTIRHAGEHDLIKIYINSYGGDLFTAIQFMRALNETQANVAISVEGACMSAATMVFLTGNMFEVSAHSMFMFHNYSGGTFGKGGEMLDQLQHERAWSEKLLREVYSGFLTEKEIESMLNNKDIWMDGDEVVKRLKSKAKKVKSNSKQEDKDNG
jgi:ATP-dependent protease ClpP protease subunit